MSTAIIPDQTFHNLKQHHATKRDLAVREAHHLHALARQSKRVVSTMNGFGIHTFKSANRCIMLYPNALKGRNLNTGNWINYDAAMAMVMQMMSIAQTE